MQLSYPALALLGFAVTIASLFVPVALQVARTLTKKYDVELTIADRLVVYPADATPDEIADRIVRALSRSIDGEEAGGHRETTGGPTDRRQSLANPNFFD